MARGIHRARTRTTSGRSATSNEVLSECSGRTAASATSASRARRSGWTGASSCPSTRGLRLLRLVRRADQLPDGHRLPRRRGLRSALGGRAEHVIGKDILKPHAIFWPTMLRAIGLRRTRHLNVHGYWNVDDRKVSKSLGNMISPLIMRDKYGFESFRYYLLRDMSFGVDASFTEERSRDAHQRRPRQQPRQPGEPDAQHDRALRRRPPCRSPARSTSSSEVRRGRVSPRRRVGRPCTCARWSPTAPSRRSSEAVRSTR